MMFTNRAHGGLNMVYRRNDGNIGWVDPRLGTASDGMARQARQ
jgi:ribosome hibernation promoting factor